MTEEDWKLFRQGLEQIIKQIVSDPKAKEVYEKGICKIIALPDGTKVGIPHED